MKKKILNIALAVIAGIAFAACGRNSLDVYTPTNEDVSFELSSASLKVSGDDITVTLVRGVADNALSVPVRINDASGIFKLNTSSAEFDAGSYKTTVKIVYDMASVKPGNAYKVDLTFDDKLAGPGCNVKYQATIMPVLTYKNCGEITWNYGLAFNNFVRVPQTYVLQKADYTKNYYKILNAFGGGVDLEFNIYYDAQYDVYTMEITSPEAKGNGFFANPNHFLPTMAKYSGTQLCFQTFGNYTEIYDVDESENAQSMLVPGSRIDFYMFETFNNNKSYLNTSSGYWLLESMTVTK